MKKYRYYILPLAIGLGIGWVLFKNPSKTDNHQHDQQVSKETLKKQLWTCSMHPQIIQPKTGKCPICGMDLIPAGANAREDNTLTPNQFKLTKNALALADIQTTIVGENHGKGGTIIVSGKIVENEEENKVQASYFSGRIESLKVNFTGDKIRKGQLLAIIYSPELIKAQQELLTLSLKKEQPTLYNAVRNKLKLWKLTDKQIAQIESSKKVTQNVPIYATVSGTVLEKMVNVGDYVKQGQPLLKIANLNTVWANFDVYENQISFFKVGQQIAIESNAFPNQIFHAKVSFIAPVLNTKTRILTIRTVLNNTHKKLKPGLFVYGKVKEQLGKKHTKITIPTSAVLWTGKHSIVYVKPKKATPIFQMREIVLGNRLNTSYEVIKGLTKGEEIVTNGVFTVDAAAQLQGKKSMMNRTYLNR